MKFEFCFTTVGKAVPPTDDWLHEIKYDGYCLRVECDGDHVRLITRSGLTGRTVINSGCDFELRDVRGDRYQLVENVADKANTRQILI